MIPASWLPRSNRPTYLGHLSGGVASWLACRRIADQFGSKNIILIFADTLYEEASTYKFIDQCVADIKPRAYVRLCFGKNPWEVFDQVRFLGNSRVDPCSRLLKRELIAAWVKTHYRPDNSIQIFGYDWTEGHRLEKLRDRFGDWPVIAPLLEPPLFEKDQIIQAARDNGMAVPALYALGFTHNNCGGKCVKAGQAHYAHLLNVLPDVYAEAEAEENKLRAKLGDVAILRDRTCGISTPLPLFRFRNRVQCGEYDRFDYGSCSCFTEPEAE